jgi:hypothetical protein
VIGEIRAGASAAGWHDEIPVYESETAALAAEMARSAEVGATDRPVIVLLCHEDRDGVFRLLEERGFRAVDSVAELAALVPGPSPRATSGDRA